MLIMNSADTRRRPGLFLPAVLAVGVGLAGELSALFASVLRGMMRSAGERWIRTAFSTFVDRSELHAYERSRTGDASTTCQSAGFVAGKIYVLRRPPAEPPSWLRQGQRS